MQICECSDLCAAPGYPQNKFGDEFKVFLLINPEDEKPVAVVVPKQTVEPATGCNNSFLIYSPFNATGIGQIFFLCQAPKILHYYVCV